MRDDVEHLAEHLLHLMNIRQLTLITAESCTAGALSQRLADAPGAGLRFQGGFVAYTKAQKNSALGVPWDLLREKGAVAGEVARAMAEGALRNSPADLAAAITGVAGPEPDEDGNPVGKVCIAVARRAGPTEDFERHYPAEGRDAIRLRAIRDTLEALISAVTRHVGSPDIARDRQSAGPSPA
ncbi:MAG TPA: CinA family protein [Xanthobacteraceae bacterium]|jgi:nicotinamide-nucleotide amidase|nr:CinA family protein [Xanthobacteraceae bacterium]